MNMPIGPKVSAATGIGGTGTALVSAATLNVEAAAQAVVTLPTYLGFTLTQWQVAGIAGGLFFGFVGLIWNGYLAWRRDQREERARGSA
jgi:hypothetical protein